MVVRRLAVFAGVAVLAGGAWVATASSPFSAGAPASTGLEPALAGQTRAVQPGQPSHVARGSGTGPVRLRSCDHATADNQNVGGCGVLDELMDGDAVVMRCWRDTSTPPGYQTPRWFYVSEGSGSPHPGWAGWVHAELVPDQAEVPLCDRQVLDAYPLPPVEPLAFAITGKCTTAGGQLTATSSGFSPGGRYTTSTGFTPSGWMYDEHEGTVDQHGSVPWVLPCDGGQDVDIELGSVITDVTTDRRVYVSFVIPAGRQAPVTSTSRPAPAPSSISDPPRSSAPGSPAGRVLTVFDKVTNGATQVREDTPAYLSTVTRNRCRQDGCMLAGTEVGTGARLSAECQVQGARTTNGEDRSTVDDGNPQLAESTLWYGIRWPDGRFGYISEIWISPTDRGGLGLRQC